MGPVLPTQAQISVSVLARWLGASAEAGVKEHAWDWAGRPIQRIASHSDLVLQPYLLWRQKWFEQQYTHSCSTRAIRLAECRNGYYAVGCSTAQATDRTNACPPKA